MKTLKQWRDRVQSWLHLGYPPPPEGGRVLLVSLFERALTEDEVLEVIASFAGQPTPSETDIAVAVMARTHQMPSQKDIDAVMDAMIRRSRQTHE